MEPKEMLQKLMGATVAMVETVGRIPVIQAEFQLALAQKKYKKAAGFIKELEAISKEQGKWAKEMFALQNDMLEEMD